MDHYLMSNLDFRVDSHEITGYFKALAGYLTHTDVTSASGKLIELAEAVNQVMAKARQAHTAGNKLIFIGNGGSAAVASHMATDYSKNGDIRSIAFNDSSTLTCLGNDLGYDKVFSKQIEMHARP